jgi:thioredoxin reductase (NADPH)
MTLEFDEGESCYNVTTTSSKHRSRAILIAAGIGSFTPKTLSLPGASDYLGRGLHYFVKSIEPFKGRRVLIVGGGDSAVDWANMLSPLADKVTLIHRRDQFRAHEDSVIKMRAGRTQIQTFCELKSIGGKSCVDCATIYDNRSKAEQLIEVDHVLVNIGFESTLGPIAGWGLNLEGGQIVVDAMMQTNRPGIFAAGDAATFPGKLKLIATGFGEACTAVNFAKHYLDPAANIFPGHSSNMKR